MSASPEPYQAACTTPTIVIKEILLVATSSMSLPICAPAVWLVMCYHTPWSVYTQPQKCMLSMDISLWTPYLALKSDPLYMVDLSVMLSVCH